MAGDVLRTMNSILARITPGALVRLSRIFAVLVFLVMMAGYVDGYLTVEIAGLGSFALSLLLLLALPDQRASELLGAAAIWMTTAEFMSAAQTGHFDHWRWAVAVAALAVVRIPLRVQFLRQLARTEPDRLIGELDRRAWSVGALPHTAATLSLLRGEADTAGSDAAPQLAEAAFASGAIPGA